MDFDIIIESWPLYMKGLWLTVQLLALSLVAGLVLAIPTGVLAASSNWLVAAVPKAFIYFFRGTPLLVQLFMIYYGAGQFEWVRESFLWVVLREAYWCAFIAFTLNSAAYVGEMLRGAILQTPYGELEAARACGMSPLTTLRRIKLPSAYRRALPSYGNEVIFVLHGTALAGVITVVDLFGAARIVNSKHFVPFESYIAAAFIYLLLTFAIVGLFKLVERHWHAHLRPLQHEPAT